MEIILRPNNPVTESIVKILLEGNMIKVRLNEFMDEFRLFIKSQNYIWKSPYWQRIIILEFHGLTEDRLIELAYKLLDNNFIISFPFPELQEKIVIGDYIEEQTRWIGTPNQEKYKNWFLISWSKEENFYDRARRIRGSRYLKPFVVVPSEQFEMILDFAEVHDFRFSKLAQNLIEEAKEKVKKSIRVELQPKIKTDKYIKAQTIGVVADEFRDND